MRCCLDDIDMVGPLFFAKKNAVHLELKSLAKPHGSKIREVGGFGDTQILSHQRLNQTILREFPY